MSIDKLFDGSDAHLLPDDAHDDCNIFLRRRVKELEAAFEAERMTQQELDSRPNDQADAT